MRECQCATSPHKWDAEAQALPAGFQLCDLRAHLARVAIQKHSRFPNRRALKNAVRQAGNVRQRPRFAAIVMPTYLRLLAHVAFTQWLRGPQAPPLIFARLEAPALGRGGRGRTGATRGPIRRPLRWDKTYLGRDAFRLRGSHSRGPPGRQTPLTQLFSLSRVGRPMNTATNYRQLAHKCGDLALETLNPELRTLLLTMAETWARTAERHEATSNTQGQARHS